MILRYHEWNSDWDAISSFVQNQGKRLEGTRQQNGSVELLVPSEILYFESVDGSCFAYSEGGEYKVKLGFAEAIGRFEGSGFFRCSRTMALNIYKMDRLKSQPEGRIMATLSNGEQILISRKYAGELRRILKRGRRGQ